MYLNTSTYIDIVGESMKRKILVLSIFAAILVAILPISSVIGIDVVKSNAERGSVASPLFTVRSQRSIDNGDANQITTNYIGKGSMMNLFLSRQTSLQRMLNRAIKLIETRPNILDTIFDRFETNPEMVQILSENKVDLSEVKNQMSLIKNDPSLLRQMINEDEITLPIANTPEPLGLSTSSVLGCFIVMIAMIPVGLILTMLIATITIFTCLNIQGCFEDIFSNIMGGILQGLTTP